MRRVTSVEGCHSMVVLFSIRRTRPVRTRMRGAVGAGGEKPPATRFSWLYSLRGSAEELIDAISDYSRLLVN